MAVRAEPGVPLSARELEVARLVAEGLTSRQAASRMGVSERTVHAHLRHVYVKTGARSRVQLACWLTASGRVAVG